jgi:hypothetical protein
MCTITHELMAGIHTDECFVRQFHHCVNIIKCLHNLDSVAYNAPRLYLQPTAKATNLYDMLLYLTLQASVTQYFCI